MFGLWKSTSGDFYNLLETVEVFDILIKFIYSGIFKLSDYDLKTNIAVLIAADELCLNEFCEHTEKFLLNNEPLLKQNFILIQKTVNQLGQFEKLTQFYETSINDEPSLILRANDFITIQQETLLEFLTEYNQRLNPMEIWDKLIEWSIGQYNELPKNTKEWTNNEMSIFGTLINPFITFINFEKISLTNFCNNIKPFKDIFDKEFYVQMLEYYSFNEESHSKFKLDIDSKIITPFHAFLIGNFIKLSNGIQNCTFEFQLLDLEKFIFSKFVVENLGVYKNNGPDFGGNTSDLRLLEGDAKKGQCYKNSYEKLIRKVEGVFDIEDYEVFQVSTINHWEFDDEIEVEISEYNEYDYYDDPDYRGYLYDF
ncbi:unnamed protein product [Rhizophagus irregularis]|nr:unnamed protein product [Rhizophagus irregularis]